MTKMILMLRRSIVLLCLFLPQLAWSAAAPNRVFVDDDWASYASGVDPDGSDPATAMGYDAFGKLSDAIAAVAPGGTVSILGGTYREFLEIHKNLRLSGWRGIVTLALPNQASVSLPQNNPYESLIWVHDADVTIENINLSLVRAAPTGVLQAAIYFQNAAGLVQMVGVEGSSYHHGIVVDNNDSLSRLVTVQDSIVRGYKKLGMSFMGEGLSAIVLNNDLETGSANTALRGIELGWGATGHISENGIRYNACYAGASCQSLPVMNNFNDYAVGLLIVSPSIQPIEVDHNTFSQNQCHICALSSLDINSQSTSLVLNIHDNTLSDGTVGIGIFDIDPRVDLSATEYGNSLTNLIYPRQAPQGVLQVVASPTPPSPTTPVPTTPSVPANPSPTPPTSTPAVLNTQARFSATTTRTVSPDEPRYDIGSPILRNIYLSPTGSDSNDGLTIAKARKTLNGIGTRIRELEGVVDRDQVVTLSRTGYQIILLPGIYPNENRSHIMDYIQGTAQYPIIFRSSTGVHSDVQVKNTTEFTGVSYVYLLDFTINPASDALHFEGSHHILVRNMLLDGGIYNGLGGEQKSGSIAHDMFKVNQCQHVFLEDSELKGADDNTLDWVAVQTGRIIGNTIHNSHDWCAYVKGGSSYIIVQENNIYDCYTGGFTAGQGTGFEYMTAPWLFYEAMDVKVIHNKIHHVHGPGLGVAGGYNILLAHNTLYKVGDDGYIYGRTQAFDFVQGGRECDGDADQPGKCDAHWGVAGWGHRSVGNMPSPTGWIPNKHVFVFNNIVYNPTGYDTVNAIFNVDPPDTNLAETHIPSPAYADDDLVIKGNLIFGKSWYHQDPDVFSTSKACQANNPSCNSAAVIGENYINTLPPDFVNPESGNFDRVPKGVIDSLSIKNIPDFEWSVPALNNSVSFPYFSAPQGNLKNQFLSSSRFVGAYPTVVVSVPASGGVSGSPGVTGGSSGSVGVSSGGVSGAPAASGGSSGSGSSTGMASGGASGNPGIIAGSGGVGGTGGSLAFLSGGASATQAASGGSSGAGIDKLSEVSGGVSGAAVGSGGSSESEKKLEPLGTGGSDIGTTSGGLGGNVEVPSPEVPVTPQAEGDQNIAAGCGRVS